MKRTLYTGLATLAAVAAVLSATPASNASPAGKPLTNKPGSWSTRCDRTMQFGQVDPIIAHNSSSPSAHLHMFFGQPNMTNYTAPTDLRGSATTSFCKGVPDPTNQGGPVLDDRSAYWEPALFTDATKTDYVKTAYIINYYRSDGRDPRTLTGFPDDLSMIGGNAMAVGHGARDNQHIQWSCISAHSTTAPLEPTIPDTCPVYSTDGQLNSLRLLVQFPSCWTGQQGTPNYTPYLTFPVANPNYPATSGYPLTCPAGTTGFPELDVTTRFKLQDFPLNDNGTTDPKDDYYDLSNATLASDKMQMNGMTTGSHGVTAHMDFMSGWTHDEMTNMMNNCFNPPAPGVPHNCGMITGPSDG